MPLESRPMCPYCKHYHHNFSNVHDDGEEFEKVCEKCARTFHVTCWVTYMYRTDKIEEPKK